MKYQTLLKRIPVMSLVFALLMGCGAPATQSLTLVPPTSSPTIEVMLSPTQTAKPAMEKIWETNGNLNAFYRPTELALDAQGNVYINVNNV